MAGRRAQPPGPVPALSLAATGHAPTDRVNKQVETAVQDLQTKARTVAATATDQGAALTALTTRVTTLEGEVSGRLLAVRTLTGSGTYTPTAGTTRALIEGVACGGGGGGGSGGANVSAGAGGASGEYLRPTLVGTAPVALTGGSYSAPASGGAAGADTGGNGGTGSDASLTIAGTTYTLKGGGGGQGLASTAGPAFAVPGRAVAGAVAGVLRQDGERGVVTSTSLFEGGMGGSTPLGAGGGEGDAASGSSAGRAPSGYGGGGGGACVSGATGKAGAAGGAAVWSIHEYS